MRKSVCIFIGLFCSIVFIAQIQAASLYSVFVTSDVSEYDQNDFPGVTGGSRVLIGSSTYVLEEPVTVDSTPTGPGTSLSPLPGWDMWIGAFSSPVIGSLWAAEYIFHAGTESTTLDLTNCTFRELESTQNVTFAGNTIAWDPVANATSYKLRWFPWNGGSIPDVNSGFLAETDYLTQPSYTMANPTPGEYALRIDAFEFCGDNPVNRSSFYVKHTIEAESTPIPTLSEWGMIFMSLTLVGSAFWMMRQRQIL